MKILENTDKRWVVHLAVDLLNAQSSSRFDHPGIEEIEGKEAVSQARAEFLTTLRRLVDQWIDSGKSGLDRKIDTLQDRDMYKVPPGYERPLIEILGAWVVRNPPLVFVQGDGRREIWNQVQHKRGIPASYAQDLAFHEFARLLDSPTRERLSRCDACRTYFERRRAPKRDTPIYHGVYCWNCKGKGGARRTVSSRDQRKKEIVGWAASCWAKWKPTPRHGKQSEWIAQQVNRELAQHHPVHDRITGKWVTQNRKTIEAEVERRNRAIR